MNKVEINDWKSKTGRETLFFHPKSNIVFDCFPRSKSTLILSNIHSNTTGESANTWNQILRARYVASKNNISLSKKVMCIRSPQERFRSFLISKIVNPHATSILPLFFSDSPDLVNFLCGNSSGIKFSKSLNLLLNNASSSKLSTDLHDAVNCSPIFSKANPHQRKDIFYFLNYIFNEYLSFNVETILEKLLTIVDKDPILDQHIMSQSFLSTFQLSDYDNLVSVDNLNSFAVFYKENTGFDFSYGENNTSQKNTQYLFNEYDCGHESIKDLRLKTKSKITPTLKSIFSPKNLWMHFKIYERDYDLMLRCREQYAS